jgi:YaiO family outer membrane protein
MPRNPFQFLSIIIFCIIALQAQSIAETQKAFAEVEYAHASLTNGFQDWNDLNILNYFGKEGSRFIIETDYKNHFGKSAGVFGITYTQTYSLLWYQDFSAAVSTSNSIIPGSVLFTELHRKLLTDQSLVLGLGIGHNISQDPYSDTYGLFEAYYYLVGPISFQAGLRVNGSSPGSVLTTREFASINFLNERWDCYVRFETGREGYAVVGINNFKNEFHSENETIQFRYFLNQEWGIGVHVDFYQSEIYNRNLVGLDFLIRY